MLDENGENSTGSEQGKLVNKYFQFCIQKETGCGNRTKIATSIQYLSIHVGD